MSEILVITKIIAITQKKYKIFINEQFAFILYKGELSRYLIKEGIIVEQETYQKIKAMLLKRAKSRALHLLNTRAYTEKQLTDKMKAHSYPEEIIRQALHYVTSFGYINDNAYIAQYLERHSATKSIKEMKLKLLQKGIAKELLEEGIQNFRTQINEEESIRRILEKKRYIVGEAKEGEKRRIYAYLARKGFRHDDISRALQVSVGNT